MEVEQYTYEKLDYDRYEKRLESIIRDPRLVAIGIEKHSLGYTVYGYELTEFTIGSGTKDIFIVGGTHGSEIIGVDFVTQLIKHIPDLEDYDPNLITLHIIPLQNPEGFDITTQTLKEIDDASFAQDSMDYYLRYRTDNLVNAYLGNLNERFKDISGVLITPEVFINTIKESFKSPQWLNLCDEKRAIPDMVKLEQIIMNVSNISDFVTLRNEMLLKIDSLKNDSSHPYFASAITRIGHALFSDELIDMIMIKNEVVLNRNIGSRLYQERFANAGFSGTRSEELSQDVAVAYETYDIPLGSQVKYDSTGTGINLNKNRPDNPGVEVQKEGSIVYGVTPANNVRDNLFGPIGTPTIDPNNFSYAYENVVLMRLLEKSDKKGRLAGTLLYHGTGGMVYSRPYPGYEKVTPEFMAYNDDLSNSYKEKTGYRQVENADDTGFGDYLRHTYPGVLLIELSKMGGNPIAPYGDPNNYYSTINSNIEAVNNMIKTINEKNKANSKK
jgi:hypothetical protein